MWSLPDIKSLNARAKSCARAYDKEVKPAKRHTHKCDSCCTAKASVHHKYFDIFSKDAKGVRHLCTECHENGRGEDGFFVCDHCSRLMVQNYTWENYSRHDGGDTVCLACSADEHFRDDDNLINPEDVLTVTQDGEGAPLFACGVLNLHAAPHVLAVSQPVPDNIEFIENFENCNDRGEFDFNDIMRCIRELNGRKFFVVLDAAYQFSVSIGIYCRKV